MADNYSINIPITGDNKQLDDTLKKTEESFKAFQDSANQSLEALKTGMAKATANVSKDLGVIKENTGGTLATFAKLGAGISGMKAAFDTASSAVTAFFDSFVGLGDALDKASIRTGVSVKALSALKFASEQCGAGFETTVDALKTFQNLIGASSLGDTGALDKLKKSGINAKDFIGEDAEEQFKKLADYIASLKDPTEQTRVAMELFGDAGFKLLPMLKLGSSGIEQLTAEAESLGIALDSKATTAAANLSDSMNRAKSSMAGAWNVITTQLAPAVTAIFNGVAAFTREVMLLYKEFQPAINAFGTFVITVYACTKAVAAYQAVIALLPAATALATGGVAGLTAALAAMSLNPVILGIGLLAAAIVGLGTAFGDSVSEAQRLEAALERIRKVKNKYDSKETEARKTIETNKAGLARLEELDKIINAGGSAADEAKLEAAKLMQALGIGDGSPINYRMYMPNVRKSIEANIRANTTVAEESAATSAEYQLRLDDPSITERERRIATLEAELKQDNSNTTANRIRRLQLQRLKEENEEAINTARDNATARAKRDTASATADDLRKGTDAAYAQQQEAEKKDFDKRSEDSTARFKNHQKFRRKQRDEAKKKAKEDADKAKKDAEKLAKDKEAAQNYLDGTDMDGTGVDGKVFSAQNQYNKARATGTGVEAAYSRLQTAIKERDEWRIKHSRENIDKLYAERSTVVNNYQSAQRNGDTIAMAEAAKRLKEIESALQSNQTTLDSSLKNVADSAFKYSAGTSGFSAFGFSQLQGGDSPETKAIKALHKVVSAIDQHMGELNVGLQ